MGRKGGGMKLRSYQQRTLDELYTWWVQREGNPIVTVPTGGGKSIIIAELCRLLFDTWPEEHPRTVVIVPSKELAEQNAEKLVALLPTNIRVGYYSASLGRKQPDADVIVATIGSLYKAAHVLGNIRCVVIDECHLVNPDGAEAGRYRQFLSDLAKYCEYRVVGYTATPFRGNGIWLTDGEDPLFHGVASHVAVSELLDAKYLAPLIRPMDAVKTRIDTDGIKTTSGDFNIGELSERVESYLPAAAEEACALAADRKKWIAFCATVINAQHFAGLLCQQGISAEVVTGDTPKKEREELIARFRAGDIRCLVTVLALATGFDVPDVDCILWLRPTKSPVLYVQGAGRGFRIADGKTDCLWLDFSDTTERLGPVDAIKGRKRPKKSDMDRTAPVKTCEGCGEQVPAAAPICPTCGYEFPAKEQEVRKASNAAILSIQAMPSINTYPVDRVTYKVHRKEDKPDSLRVDYWSGIRMVGSEWICFEHIGFASARAQNWWLRRNPEGFNHAPGTTSQALEWIADGFTLRQPSAVVINESEKFPKVIDYKWEATA
jgi:DNA repair protein RadD